MIGFGNIRRSIVTLGLLAALGASAGDPRPAHAQAGQCTQACQAEYAKCYKDTGSNRKVCEAHLQQCLSGCINKR